MPVSAPALALLRRYGRPALLYLLTHVDHDVLIRVVHERLGAVTARRRAYREAELVDGAVGAYVAQHGVHYVVFKDGEPIDAFPPVEGDLRALLRHYERDRLRRPQDRSLARARRRVADSLEALRRRAGEWGGPGDRDGAESPRQLTRPLLERLVADVDPLLDRLTESAPVERGPDAPGVYLLTRDGAPEALGSADSLATVAVPTHAELRVLAVDDALRRVLLEHYAHEALGV